MPDLQSNHTPLRVIHIGSKSVFVLGLLAAFVLSVVTLIVLSLMYIGLDLLGVVSSVSQATEDLLKFNFRYIHVLWASGALSVVYLLFVPLISYMSAHIYNLCAAVAGGIKITAVEVEKSDI